MKNNKRGQAALEFLTTYGWAFMIILVMIGALAYFGVLNPRNLVPDSCTIQAGFTCNDYVMIDDGTAADDNINLSLVNNLGRAIDVSDALIILAGENIVSSTCPPQVASGVSDGARIVFDCPITDGNIVAGEKIKVAYEFNYTNSVGGDFPHRVSGTLTAAAI